MVTCCVCGALGFFLKCYEACCDAAAKGLVSAESIVEREKVAALWCRTRETTVIVKVGGQRI